MVKKILCLLCVFVVMFSCKQTQLTSNFNKRAKKIYVKPSLHNNDIEIALNEKKTPKHSKSISREVKDTFNYNDLKPKEFIADAGISEIKVISNENKLHQKLTRIDSVLKSKDSTLIENEEFLELFNKTKKFSLYSLYSILSSLLTMRFLTNVFSLSILFWISLVMTLVMSILTFISTIKLKKYLKKNNKKLRNLSDKKIKYIIRLASIFPLLIISALILSLFVLLTFSISI